MLLGDSGQLNSPNADLWTLMADDVHGVCNVQTTKVAAHQEGCVATTPIEELFFCIPSLLLGLMPVQMNVEALTFGRCLPGILALVESLMSGMP